MHECKNEWNNELIYKWNMNGLINKWSNEWMNDQINTWMNE